jgi:hypothetical protein
MPREGRLICWLGRSSVMACGYEAKEPISSRVTVLSTRSTSAPAPTSSYSNLGPSALVEGSERWPDSVATVRFSSPVHGVAARSVGQNQLADSGFNTSSQQNCRRAAETPEVDRYGMQISGFGWLNWVLTHAPTEMIAWRGSDRS